jgi:hypothetical protein
MEFIESGKRSASKKLQKNFAIDVGHLGSEHAPSELHTLVFSTLELDRDENSTFDF